MPQRLQPARGPLSSGDQPTHDGAWQATFGCQNGPKAAAENLPESCLGGTAPLAAPPLLVLHAVYVMRMRRMQGCGDQTDLSGGTSLLRWRPHRCILWHTLAGADCPEVTMLRWRPHRCCCRDRCFQRAIAELGEGSPRQSRATAAETGASSARSTRDEACDLLGRTASKSPLHT